MTGDGRYQTYRVGADGVPHRFTSTDDVDAIGLMLVTGAAEGEWAGCRFGLKDMETGQWIINPYEGGSR